MVDTTEITEKATTRNASAGAVSEVATRHAVRARMTAVSVTSIARICSLAKLRRVAALM